MSLEERIKNNKKVRSSVSHNSKPIHGITRRRLLYTGVATAALAATGITGIVLRESAQKKNSVGVMKAIIHDYNRWFENLNPTKLSKDGGIERFIEIYNKWIERLDKSEGHVPKLSSQYETVKEFNSQINPMITNLEKQGYYFLPQPTMGNWKGASLHYVSLMLGKTVTKEKSKASRDGNVKEYTYLKIDTPQNEPANSYTSLPSGFTAFTYLKGDEVIVMQFNSGYRDSAYSIFENLNRRPSSPRDFSRIAAYGDLISLRQQDAVLQIQERLMRTSREHEEQHVLDDLVEISSQGATTENMQKLVIGEMRGLFAPLFGANPKAALYNIYSWCDWQDQMRQLAGRTASSILKDVSGKDFETLHEENDDNLRKFSRLALKGTDIFYNPMKQGKAPTPAMQEEYSRFIDNLRHKK